MRGALDIIRESVDGSKLSRYEIAKRSGVDQAALSRFMNGGSLRLESIERLCPVLGLRLTITKQPTAVRSTKRRKA